VTIYPPFKLFTQTHRRIEQKQNQTISSSFSKILWQDYIPITRVFYFNHIYTKHKFYNEKSINYHYLHSLTFFWYHTHLVS